MIKRIKEILVQIKQRKTQIVEHEKMKKYYRRLQQGALVLQYIHNDMEQHKKKMNRAERRRYDVSLKHDGKFSAEIIQKYATHFDKMSEYINGELAKQIGLKKENVKK